jgi:hypothetical protein
MPAHSASAIGAASSSSALMLNETNTFSPPGSQASSKSPRRANSPLRDNITILASASPPTITEPSSGLKAAPLRRVRDVIEQLEYGLDRGWIPRQLRGSIEKARTLNTKGLSLVHRVIVRRRAAQIQTLAAKKVKYWSMCCGRQRKFG